MASSTVTQSSAVCVCPRRRQRPDDKLGRGCSRDIYWRTIDEKTASICDQATGGGHFVFVRSVLSFVECDASMTTSSYRLYNIFCHDDEFVACKLRLLPYLAPKFARCGSTSSA